MQVPGGEMINDGILEGSSLIVGNRPITVTR